MLKSRISTITAPTRIDGIEEYQTASECEPYLKYGKHISFKDKYSRK